ncbi:heme oxygenase (biliverdin-producing) [Actinoplanes teichomyceticus]|uniref:Heme oxygenase n=1 Tax=Actinoplanes teichomyceticus TaxID=1867 RepID=A0A561VQU6_ACTTI|nr:biliverdin-producing heme oxygenase [Actinoplanes teichomyceticus]TWG13970.1 heme oxygenase [Actinoplanes teichomyceticus]GIF12209.1 hypothetical protein Ate01nite_22410 [Actinoplanes teichomyceticus]
MWHPAGPLEADPPATDRVSAHLAKILADAQAAARHSRFVQALVAGRLPVTAYAELAAQHWFVYEALEQATAAMAGDPVAGRFCFPELLRLPAIEADLTFLYGAGWPERIVALPSTTTYCTRIRSVAVDRDTGFVAHHGTRYLGDLDGGQWLGAAVFQAYRFDRRGYRFFVFEGVDPRLLRTRYRQRLDAVGWGRAERGAFLSEAAAAAQLGLNLLVELGNRWT